MNLPDLYMKLIKDNKILDNLDGYCYVRLVEPYEIPVEYGCTSYEQTIVIAEDGSGGMYVLYGEGDPNFLPIGFLSSEGQVGSIAENFHQLISLVVFYPYWSDLLKFSNGGSLLEMMKSQLLLEKDFEIEMNEEYRGDENYESYKKFQKDMIQDFKLDTEKLIEKLQLSVGKSKNIKIVSNDGEKLDSLYGEFKPTDNPFWK